MFHWTVLTVLLFSIIYVQIDAKSKIFLIEIAERENEKNELTSDHRYRQAPPPSNSGYAEKDESTSEEDSPGDGKSTPPAPFDGPKCHRCHKCRMNQQLKKNCRCRSENCYAGESCAKFKKDYPGSPFGKFDRNCTTGCTTRCKQQGTLCSDGYPMYCTCPDSTRDVDNYAMCPTTYQALKSCTCSDGKIIRDLELRAPDVWLEPARGF